MSPRKNATTSLVRPDLGAPPRSPSAAICWAILQCPDEWDLGEWLARLLRDGIWADATPDALADQIVGAAVRGRGEDPPE